jgi:N utilization substance protein B
MARQPSPAHQEKRLKQSAARLAAVQALFQIESGGADYREVQDEFETHRLGHTVDGEVYREADLDLFRALLSAVVSRQAEVDQLTDRALVAKWPINRIDPTLRALFRAAGAELIAMVATPPKVIIKEFVDVAFAFYPDGKEPAFVNAVLDHMAREVRPDAFA